MGPRRVILAFMTLGLGLPLAACNTAPGTATGFRTTYFAARGALEEGRYGQANRQYQQLMTSAGPFLPRVQLEYAHSLLRAGDYAAAAQVAEQMAATETGAAGASALAVAATARHELGLAALAQGQTEAGRADLQKARAGMAEVLESHPELDPLGALAGRRASIEVRLRAL
jgi:tetratricopeptide (TPR) repeat protein